MLAFTSILVDVDATASAQPALERAALIARNCGAALRVVDVLSVPADARRVLRADLEDELMARRRQELAGIVYRIYGVPVDSDVLAGQPIEALIQDVLRFGHDLLVRAQARDLVARGPKPFGAINMELFRHCPCPVWAVGPGAPPGHPKIVAAVDVDSEDPFVERLNAKIVETALLLTRLHDGSLSLLHAWRPVAEKRVFSHASNEEFAAYLDTSRRQAGERLRRLAESFADRLRGVQIELHRGDVETVVPEFAVSEGVDLIVMGTVGRRGLARHLLGNTAERLLKKLPCSVLAVKPDEFVSSVSVTDLV
jgi:nucleotide-binding universal stress UspA family protein